MEVVRRGSPEPGGCFNTIVRRCVVRRFRTSLPETRIRVRFVFDFTDEFFAVPQFPLRLFTLIALCAVANTGLANFVTSSRLVYGMSRQGLQLRWLGRVHSKLRTPNTAVFARFCVALGLAVSGSLRQLAGATSCLILAVFFTTNVALIVIRRRDANQSTSSLVQHSLPYVAAASCVGLLSCAPLAALATAGGLMLAGLLGAWWQPDATFGDADEARSIPHELEEP